jgi:hypothetical protein
MTPRNKPTRSSSVTHDAVVSKVFEGSVVAGSGSAGKVVPVLAHVVLGLANPLPHVGQEGGRHLKSEAARSAKLPLEVGRNPVHALS